MTFISELDAEIMRVEEEIKQEILIPALTAALVQLNVGSPIWSGWYANNHRVTFSWEGDVALEPSSRPPKQGAQGAFELPPVQSRVDREVKTAETGFKLGMGLYIGNAVPYAASIENGTPTRPQGDFYAKTYQVLLAGVEELGK